MEQDRISKQKKSAYNDLHILASFTHGWLTAFHMLGAVYNLKRRNWFDVAVHTAGVVYSANAAVRHARKCHVDG